MHPNLTLDCSRETERIISFIRQATAEAGRGKLVLGLSGGIDSALVAALGVRALGAANVFGVLLPFCTSNPCSKEHGTLVTEWLGISGCCLDITEMVNPLLNAYPQMSALRKGNIMARSRMIVLYDQSEMVGGLVAGTSNRTETLLGYFTMHGDSAAALKPIAHLYKYQVRQLARYLGVPPVIIDKAPSADLWEGQTDEGDLGFSYDQADEVLYLLSECHWQPEQIAGPEHDLATVLAVRKRMNNTAFKRAEAPALISLNLLAQAPEVHP